MIKLSDLILEALQEKEDRSLLEISLQDIEKQFVNTGRINKKDFEEIKRAASKSAYATWLAARVSDKLIKPEDIYKFKDYLSIFEKFKNRYPVKDINQVKDKLSVDQFVKTSAELEDAIDSAAGGNPSTNVNNLVPLKGVEDLKDNDIEFLGLVDGYQCFKIPSSLSGNEDAFKSYRKWLARCSGRKEGEGIHICTMADQGHFDHYLDESDLYVFFDMSDPRSPYQFSYHGEGQFMDKNDRDITSYKYENFFRFLKDKEGEDIPATVLLSDPDYKFNPKDFLDKQGNLQLFGDKLPATLPDNINVKGTFEIVNSGTLEKIGSNTSVGRLIVQNCTKIKELPSDIKIKTDLTLKYTEIVKLPDNLAIEGDLNLFMNSSFKDLPKKLKVGGDLLIKGTKISKLPADLIVFGDVYILGKSYFDGKSEQEIKDMAQVIQGDVKFKM